MKSKKLSMKQLQTFWERWAIHGKLSTTGARKLIILTFGNKAVFGEIKESYIKGYDDPPFPFWVQNEKVQNQILAMLKTNWLGREFVECVEHQIFGALKRLSKLEKPKSQKEGKIMGITVKEIVKVLKNHHEVMK